MRPTSDVLRASVMNLSNLRVGVKLGMGFAIMVVLTTFTGGLAIVQMGRINGAISELSENWLPSLNQVGEMQALLNDMRRAELQHVITASAEEKKSEADRLSIDIVKLNEAGRKFEALLDSPTERQAFAKISASVERVEQGTALVDKAGDTMTEVVSSIKRVTDIMGEISAASNEQSNGVTQVVEAVTQMDQTTQQNAALVEEMAAATANLSSQSQELVQTVAMFKLEEGHHSADDVSPGMTYPLQISMG